MDNPSDRLFVDTSYLVARFNSRDQYHERACELEDAVSRCRELWTTDAVLLEFGAAFSSPANRLHVVSAWDGFHAGGPCRVVEASSPQMQQAMVLFRSRMDKAWSLADCLSFVVMQQQGLTDALTADQHFVQADFRALMLEE
jgi:predicted nucleic acid-binding protein